MKHQPLVQQALEDFQRLYPRPVMGRAHRVFVGRDEAAVIEMRPRDGEQRRFMIDVISRVGPPSRYQYAIGADGTIEGRRDDWVEQPIRSRQ